jgi:Alpha/beta hydrolase
VTPEELLPYPPDDPAWLQVLAQRCEMASRRLDVVRADLLLDRVRLAGAWRGLAARTCTDELAAAAVLAVSGVEPVHRGALLLRGQVGAVEAARAEIDGLRRRYAGLGATARPERAAEPDADVLAVLRRHQGVLEEVQQRAAVTGRALADLAADLAPPAGVTASGAADPSVVTLAARLPLLAASRRSAGVLAGPPAVGAAADEVHAWWDLLTDVERDRAVHDMPGRVGALAGLPVGVRSAANERRLALDLAALERRARTAALDAADRDWLTTCRLVAAELARVRAGRDPVTGRHLVGSLLVFAPLAFGGQGRVALAVGDLDTADDVAFVVPGLRSDVHRTLGALTDDAVRLTAAARQASPAATVATVAWMGYDAPGWLGVPVDRAASAGAALLGRDVAGVRAARAVPPHVTLVGHSYGTATVGLGLREHMVSADDVVLLGSPGADAVRAGALGVPKGHVFVGADSRDPVSYLGWFGPDPASSGFDAVRFEAEDSTRDPWRPDLADHGKYLDAHTESLANTARVVAGRYDEVVRAPYRHDLPFVPHALGAVIEDPESFRTPTTVP